MQDVDNELASGQKTISDEFPGADGHGSVGLAAQVRLSSHRLKEQRDAPFLLEDGRGGERRKDARDKA